MSRIIFDNGMRGYVQPLRWLVMNVNMCIGRTMSEAWAKEAASASA